MCNYKLFVEDNYFKSNKIYVLQSLKIVKRNFPFSSRVVKFAFSYFKFFLGDFNHQGERENTNQLGMGCNNPLSGIQSIKIYICTSLFEYLRYFSEVCLSDLHFSFILTASQ